MYFDFTIDNLSVNCLISDKLNEDGLRRVDMEILCPIKREFFFFIYANDDYFRIAIRRAQDVSNRSMNCHVDTRNIHNQIKGKFPLIKER